MASVFDARRLARSNAKIELPRSLAMVGSLPIAAVGIHSHFIVVHRAFPMPSRKNVQLLVLRHQSVILLCVHIDKLTL